MKCRKLFRVIACAAATIFAFACAESPSSNNYTGSSSPITAVATYDYSGPGSAYAIRLDDLEESFEVSIADSITDHQHTWIVGTFERHTNGFVELTVTDADGTLAPSVDDVAIAIEVPGFGLVLRPFGGAAEFVPSLVTDYCPTVDLSANWILTSCNDGGASCDAESTTIPFFGTFDYDVSAETATYASRFDIETASDLGSAAILTDTCGSSVLLNSDTIVYLNNTDGAAIVHESTDDTDDTRHAFALPLLAIDSAAALGGTYYGMAFDKDDDSGTALKLDINDAGTAGTLIELDEAELADNVTGADFGTIAITSVNMIGATAADGWMTGTFTPDGGAARPLYCMASHSIGDLLHEMIACVGQSGADEEEFFNLVFISGHP